MRSFLVEDLSLPSMQSSASCLTMGFTLPRLRVVNERGLKAIQS